MNDPVTVELNVDSALLLKQLVGIDSYPAQLALYSDIHRLADRDRVNSRVAEQLTAVGLLDDGRVNPVVAHWLHCLDRPDVELVAYIVNIGQESAGATLSMSLVRRDDSHVLAMRCDDHVVFQSVFVEGDRIDVLTAALSSVLGSATAPAFEPITANRDEWATLPTDPDGRRRVLSELGATSRAANILARTLDRVERHAEVLMVEHRDGDTTLPEVSLSVIDTAEGRIVVMPKRSLDGRIQMTYMPGDDGVLHAGVRALVESLPGQSWFEPRRG
ncbi:ESX secretion-associated protein EspG [Nocardia yamanashiensis]|uniref:ESX secretion-associated protein EspG n=1 Tax=Nocardia yamanashiensis TaxID=209247 RepID=UPI000832B2D4|nr:ESX secretion-associated protein EspG [Nocardia yamanashiensis]